MFAQQVARGLNHSEAYKKIYRSLKSNGSRLLRVPAVQNRINQLRASSATGSTLTLRECRAFLAKVVRTPVGCVDESSVLAQRVQLCTNGLKKIWIPDKRKCLELDARLDGDWQRGEFEVLDQSPNTIPAPENPLWRNRCFSGGLQ